LFGKAKPIARLVLVSVAFSSLARASDDPGLVPISWALDVRSGRASNVAVAVPWSLGYSHGQALQRPTLFRFFPHVSLLGSGDAKSATLGNNPEFAIGCGIGLANALALGVSVKVNDPFAHAYLMAGVSLTDLLKFALY
jgi:hypothetical protein